MRCIPEVYVVEYYANGQEVRQVHIDIHEQSEDYLAQLVKRAVAGEDIIFDSNGTSVAKLVPLKQDDKKPRRGGQWKGKVKILMNCLNRLWLLLVENLMLVNRDARLIAYNISILDA